MELGSSPDELVAQGEGNKTARCAQLGAGASALEVGSELELGEHSSCVAFLRGASVDDGPSAHPEKMKVTRLRKQSIRGVAGLISVLDRAQ